MRVPEVLHTGIEKINSGISLLRPLVTAFKENKEISYITSLYVGFPLTVWALGQVSGDVQTQNLIPRMVIPETAALVVTTVGVYLSARLQRKNPH